MGGSLPLQLHCDPPWPGPPGRPGSSPCCRLQSRTPCAGSAGRHDEPGSALASQRSAQLGRKKSLQRVPCSLKPRQPPCPGMSWLSLTWQEEEFAVHDLQGILHLGRLPPVGAQHYPNVLAAVRRRVPGSADGRWGQGGSSCQSRERQGRQAPGTRARCRPPRHGWQGREGHQSSSALPSGPISSMTCCQHLQAVGPSLAAALASAR